MTTYQEAADIALDLKDKGIAYQVMNFQGWSNGGYYADVYDRITGLSKLGGKKKLEALNDTMDSIGGRLYVDVPFQDVTKIQASSAPDILCQAEKIAPGTVAIGMEVK